MATLKEQFGKRLHDLRIEKGYTSQKALAEAIGISQSTINFYESGDRQPDIEYLKKIADFFGVSYDYMLGESDAKQREYIDISKTIGLDDAAIEILSKWKRTDDDFIPNQAKLKLINKIIVNESFNSFIHDFLDYLAMKKRADGFRSLKIDEANYKAKKKDFIAESQLLTTSFDLMENCKDDLMKLMYTIEYDFDSKEQYELILYSSILELAEKHKTKMEIYKHVLNKHIEEKEQK